MQTVNANTFKGCGTVGIKLSPTTQAKVPEPQQLPSGKTAFVLSLQLKGLLLTRI